MPDTTAQPPQTINDMLRAQTRIQPGGAQEALVSRLNQQQIRQRQPRRRPLVRDSQEQDMNDGLRQSYTKNQMGEPLPAIMSHSPNQQPDQEQKNPPAGGEAENPEEPEEAENPAAELRRQKLEEKQKKAEEEQKTEEEESPGLGDRMKQGTSELLRYAWGLQLAILTFLPGLAYVNLHVFLHWALGDRFFCKLGEEWMPDQLQVLSKETAGKLVTKNVGLVEVMLLVLLDMVAGAIIFTSLGLVVMIITWMGASWWGKLTYIWEALWGLGWGGVKAIVELFSA
jgi:hypothetical protein